ncbi:hypothetical protein CPC08DRAFT_770846 [Agrocybe pediades]|nr:hypothetical protein CPC08DRAFT_770846 [Agrocybe pediades]
MAILGLWPGLPFMRFGRLSAQRAGGVNWIAYSPPTLTCLGYNHGTPDAHFIPALLVLKTYDRSFWLIFEDNKPGLFGSVVIIDVDKFERPAIYPLPDPDDDVWEYVNMPFPNWIDFLRHHWDQFANWAVEDGQDFSNDAPVDRPVKYKFCAVLPPILPSLWLSVCTNIISK